MRRGLASGRDEAKRLIASGAITVDGSSILKAATLVASGSAIRRRDDGEQWASRGGKKLAHAIDHFRIDPAGCRALDVGASTGGFTDVLLRGGVASVAAVDVGYGQLLWRLSQDARVTVFDRTNFRKADPAALGAPFDLVVVDVSFISVARLAAQLSRVGAPAADYVVLVKPQFEVGPDRVDRGGIVRDPEHHGEAIRVVTRSLKEAGIGVDGVTASPITGSKGNREFFVHGQLGAAETVTADRIAEVCRS